MGLDELLKNYKEEDRLELARIIYKYLTVKFKREYASDGVSYTLRDGQRVEAAKLREKLMSEPWNVPYYFIREMNEDLADWQKDLNALLFNINPPA